MHGYFGVLPRLVRLIASERARNPHALLVDAGDLFIPDRFFDVQSTFFRHIGFDLLAPGNGEKDDMNIARKHEALGVPVVVANIAEPSPFPKSHAYKIIDIDAKRLAFLGLTAATPYPKGHPLEVQGRSGNPVHEPVETAREYVPKLRETADLVFVISHLGLYFDSRLAVAVDGIDGIFGGHSHNRLEKPILINGTLIAQPGTQASHLGVFDIDTEKLGPSGDIAHAISYRLEPTWQDMVPDHESAALVERELKEKHPASLTVIGESSGCCCDPWRENS